MGSIQVKEIVAGMFLTKTRDQGESFLKALLANQQHHQQNAGVGGYIYALLGCQGQVFQSLFFTSVVAHDGSEPFDVPGQVADDIFVQPDAHIGIVELAILRHQILMLSIGPFPMLECLASVSVDGEGKGS